MCHAICPITTCEENYISETARHRHERIKDHNGRDHKSHIKSHIIIAFKKRHDNVAQENFKIIAKNFRNNK